jgi:hypothetical protein
MPDIWELSKTHILLNVREKFLVKNLGESRISKVYDAVANPSTVVHTIMFEGYVIGPHDGYSKVWQFRLNGSAVEARPKGGGSLIINGKYTSLKNGEWIPAPWVPQSAIDAVVNSI